MKIHRSLLGLVLLCISACDDRPPLLRGTSGGNGGNANLCELAKAPKSPGYATSPDLSRRLSADFPIGSPESVLTRELKQQGFTIAAAACADNPAVRMAGIVVKGDGQYRFDEYADIYWTAGRDGNIIWIVGRTWVDGL